MSDPAPLRSWKTTLAGVLAALGVILPQAAAFFDGDPATTPNWQVVIGAVITAGALFGLGAAARDNDKSSEAVGAA